MNVYCPECQEEKDCDFHAELYHCRKCEEDFASYTKPTETMLRELMKIQAEHMETKNIAINGFLQELKQLRYKTSEQERFICWVWSVYARNVCDAIYAIMGATTYDTEGEAKDGKWALPKECFDLLKRLDEYTQKIYDGTYQAALPAIDKKNELWEKGS